MTNALTDGRRGTRSEQAGPPTGRTQAERSDTTRRKVMDAALQVLRERGYAGFRTEAVAMAAGVSRGAMLHHFPKKRDLIISAYEYLYEQLVQASLARGREVSEFDTLLDALIEDAREFFLGKHFLAIIDVLVSAANEPDIRQDILTISKKNRFPVERAWAERLSACLPRETAEDLVFMTFNLFRGFATRTFIDDDRRKFDRITALWKEMVRDHIDAGRQPKEGLCARRGKGRERRRPVDAAASAGVRRRFKTDRT